MQDWDLAISPQSLVDQIDEEGAAHGLGADFDEDMGVVFACEIVPRVEQHGGLGGFVDEAPVRRLCSVDDAHPLSAVYGNRITKGEEKPADRYALLDAQIALEKQRKADDHRDDFKSVIARSMRGGAIFYGGQLADGAMNRRARRVREALRRRGG